MKKFVLGEEAILIFYREVKEHYVIQLGYNRNVKLRVFLLLLQIYTENPAIIGLFHFLSVQGDGRKKFKSIFTLDFIDMNILSPGKQLGEFSVSLEFHSELLSIFASFVLSKCQWM